MRMKISAVHVTPSYYPNVGGLEHHVYYVNKHLIGQGVDSRVLTKFDDSRKPRRETMDGIPVRRLGLPDKNHLTAVRWMVNVFNTLVWIRSVTSESFNILHLHGPSLFAFRYFNRKYITPFYFVKKLRLKGVPILLTLHGMRIHYCEETGYQKAYDTDKLDIDVGTRFVGVDRTICRDLQAKYFIPKERITHQPNGVDTALFKPGTASPQLKEKLGIQKTDKIVFLPRRLDPKNGIKYAIEALARVKRVIPSVKLLVVAQRHITSDDQYTNDIFDLISSLDLAQNVICLGAVPYAEMPDHYRLAALCVIPSLWEATSLAALESMASGVPVVASDIGGLSEIVAPGAGVLIEPRNPGLLAEKIIEMLNQGESEKQRTAFNCTQNARKYDWAENARTILGIYRKLLSGSNQQDSAPPN